jgi:hypothetical protein
VREARHRASFNAELLRAPINSTAQIPLWSWVQWRLSVFLFSCSICSNSLLSWDLEPEQYTGRLICRASSSVVLQHLSHLKNSCTYRLYSIRYCKFLSLFLPLATCFLLFFFVIPCLNSVSFLSASLYVSSDVDKCNSNNSLFIYFIKLIMYLLLLLLLLLLHSWINNRKAELRMQNK